MGTVIFLAFLLLASAAAERWGRLRERDRACAILFAMSRAQEHCARVGAFPEPENARGHAAHMLRSAAENVLDTTTKAEDFDEQ